MLTSLERSSRDVIWENQNKQREGKFAHNRTRTQMKAGEISLNESFILRNLFDCVDSTGKFSLAKNLLFTSRLERSFSFSFFLAKGLKVSRVTAEFKL